MSNGDSMATHAMAIRWMAWPHHMPWPFESNSHGIRWMAWPFDSNAIAFKSKQMAMACDAMPWHVPNGHGMATHAVAI